MHFWFSYNFPTLFEILISFYSKNFTTIFDIFQNSGFGKIALFTKALLPIAYKGRERESKSEHDHAHTKPVLYSYVQKLVALDLDTVKQTTYSKFTILLL